MKYALAPIQEDLVETITIPCRLCGSDRSWELFQADNIRRKAKRFFRLVKCEDCSLTYFNPSPTENSLRYYYEDYVAHVPQRINFIEKLYYRFFRYPRTHKSTGRILDIGCGNGKYLDYMRSRGWDTVGVDYGSGCRYARDVVKLCVYDGDLWQHKFPDQSFDVITLWFVIEHIWNPMRLLEECQRILRPGGQLIISTSNIDSFEARFFKRFWWHLLAPEHLTQFDRHSLTALIEKKNFKILYFRHEPICGGIIGSIQNIFDNLKVPLNVNSLFFKFLFAPLDFFCSLLGGSGLITIYASKNTPR